MTPDDETLVRQCLDGDAAAFETLVERYEKKLFNVAFRMLNDMDAARDVTQTVLLKSYRSLKSFNARYKFYSWIYRIAINESTNVLNKRHRMQAIDDRMLSVAMDTDRFSSRSELSEAIQEALMNLKQELRSVIILRHYLDCSYRAIGRILDVPEKTVKSRLFSARQQLKDALSIHGILKT
jgi:RNA polymerase sigma-70 factor (ECF subfamily)